MYDYRSGDQLVNNLDYGEVVYTPRVTGETEVRCHLWWQKLSAAMDPQLFVLKIHKKFTPVKGRIKTELVPEFPSSGTAARQRKKPRLEGHHPTPSTPAEWYHGLMSHPTVCADLVLLAKLDALGREHPALLKKSSSEGMISVAQSLLLWSQEETSKIDIT